MVHEFDIETGMCQNPITEFAYAGKYISLKITSASTPAGVVFGYYFRGVRAYEIEACLQNGHTTPADNKKRELKKIIDSGIIFFERIKYEEVKVIQSGKFDEATSRQKYEQDIAMLRVKRTDLFQLKLFND